jgi:hypothetical protein
MKPGFYLGIWNGDRNKIIVLPSFQLATHFNSQKTNNLGLLMNSVSLICSWILVFPIGILEVSTSRKSYLNLFHFFTRLLTSKHLKLYSTYLVGRNGTMWQTCFSAPQNAKKKISLNLKTKCVTEFLLTVSSSSMMDYTFHYVVIT